MPRDRYIIKGRKYYRRLVPLFFYKESNSTKLSYNKGGSIMPMPIEDYSKSISYYKNIWLNVRTNIPDGSLYNLGTCSNNLLHVGHNRTHKGFSRVIDDDAIFLNGIICENTCLCDTAL